MQMSAPRPRLLVFVIAYQAEGTLRRVLERIPARVFAEYACEVLVVDDASADRTFQIGNEYAREHPEVPLTVLRNEHNQGYGGNQKVGYTYAISEGFDFVAMVHGDGQYAPEELPRLLEPLRRGEADAVFGSRMMTRFGALQGGMPLYKYLGNRVLTFFQNRMLGTRLTEFHSGYRIYSVRTLQAIPYRLNSNDFHFDTEIIIQLFNGRRRIVELPIPTFYGDEICRVNGIKYAKDVFVATTLNVFHRAGLLYQRRFDPQLGQPPDYQLKLGYPSSHSWALAAVPDGARVLDLAPGPQMARALLAKGCSTLVVDRVPLAPAAGQQVVVQDLDEPLRFHLGDCDWLLLLDTIEHLRDPELFLERLRAQCDYRPRRLLVTSANVAFVVQRVMLLLGQFNYGRQGVLDRTHTRLFTFRSLQRLLVDCGFRIREVRGVPAPFPKVFGDGPLARFLLGLNRLLILVWRNLFSYQIYIEAESTPDVDFVLQGARRQGGARSVPHLSAPAEAPAAAPTPAPTAGAAPTGTHPPAAR